MLFWIFLEYIFSRAVYICCKKETINCWGNDTRCAQAAPPAPGKGMKGMGKGMAMGKGMPMKGKMGKSLNCMFLGAFLESIFFVWVAD